MLRRFLQYLFSDGFEGRSPQWSRERAAWIKEHGECAACGTTDDLQVHHKKSFKLYPQLELDPTNFITLCMKAGHECHYRIGHGLLGWDWFNPNVEADAKASRKMMAGCVQHKI
jgi:hypothetical protein